MLQKLRTRMESEQGFTLIELLVVILIIGILAAIALPTFLGQRSKGQDSSAKSDARNLVSQVESCYATEQNYDLCNTQTELEAGEGVGSTGLTFGSGAGQVEVTAAGVAPANTWTIVGHSRSGNNFTIQKSASGITRTCTTTGKGACPSSGNW
jgi:type IV pilus assembly protein PilA